MMMVIVVDSFVLFPPFGSTILKPDLLGTNGRIETLRRRKKARERKTMEKRIKSLPGHELQLIQSSWQALHV